MKILFVTAEAHPLVKTGGLADVCGSLPLELQRIGHDVRLALPAYPTALERARDLAPVATLDVPLAPAPVRLLLGTMPDGKVPLYLVDSPAHFNRPGSPYGDATGRDWPDNAQRFATFCRAVTLMATGAGDPSWRPDVVHCHDWHTGLIPALLQRATGPKPATIFTIHNLAYQGLFPYDTFQRLQLPSGLWAPDGLEFYGRMSFIKGGLVFADSLTTVSPTYADEICTPKLGCGLDELLRRRRDRLCGILNGADYEEWDPSRDPFIPKQYTADSLEVKAENRRHLREAFGLEQDEDTPLIASVGRLVEQKGIDLMVDAMPSLMDRDIQLLVMGNGEQRFGDDLRDAARRYDGRVAVHVGYTEELAHQVEAGADMFLMPSRFEPCGLTQLYSMRYGTIPIVRRTGGLADTVVDADEESVAAGRANGFVFDEATQSELLGAVDRAVECYAGQPDTWRQIATTCMAQEYSWNRSAGQYRELYRGVVAERQAC